MGLMKKMASVLVTASLLFGLVGTAFAQSPEEIQAGAARMQQLGIVNGDATGDLKLGDPITRAQLMKIMVWAFGQKDNAQILKGANAFPDTATHWASGEIAIAKNIIVEKNHFEMGMPDGTFAPEGKVTAAQAVAFLMKFLGISPDTAKTWPNNYLDAAVSSGMISAEVRSSIAANANTEATRGLVFFLADTAFAGYPVSTGKTVYTTYVKPSAPTLTLEATDVTTASKVTVNGTVSADALSVYVGSTTNKVTVSGGKFSFDYDLSMGANTITVGAVDLVGAVTTKTLTVTRTVGTAASIEVVPALSAKAGATVDLPVSVKDNAGNVISGAAVTVTGEGFSYADGKVTVPAKVGSYTLAVKSGDLSANVAVTVTAGDLASIAISPATASIGSGQAQKFVAVGKDAHGNDVAVTPTWSASSGVIDAAGNFAATASGTTTVTATVGSLSGTSTVTVYGIATRIAIAAGSDLVANKYSATTITASVVDSTGNVVPNYTGTISFSVSNTDIADLDSYSVQAVNGVATAELTAGATVGNVIVSAAATGLTGGSATVYSAAQELTSFKLSVDPSTLGADASSQVKVYVIALDQAGKSMVSSLDNAANVRITINNPSIAQFGTGVYTQDVSVQNVDGAAGYVRNYATITSRAALGSSDITATVTSPTSYSAMAVTPVTVSTTLIGAPAQLSIDPIADQTAGVNRYVYVRVKDVNGNQVTRGADLTGLVITLRDDAGNTFPAGITAAAGLGKARFAVTQNTAGDYVYTAVMGNIKATQTAKITAADAAQVTLAALPSNLLADGASTATLRAKVVDEFGNLVENGSYNVTFTKSASNGSTANFLATTVATVGGYATVTVTSTRTVSTVGDTYAISVPGLTAANTVAVTTAIFGTPTSVAISYGDNNGDGNITTADETVTAGDEMVVKVAVKDNSAAPLTITTDNGRAVTLEVHNPYTGATDTLTANTVRGVATFTVKETAAAPYYLIAKSAGLNDASTVGALLGGTAHDATFEAGEVAGVQVTTDVDALKIDNGVSYADINVVLVDTYGNEIATRTGDAISVTLRASGTAYGFFTVTNTVTGTKTDTLTAQIDQDKVSLAESTVNIKKFFSGAATGSTTISASATDLNSTSVSVESKLIGAIAGFKYSTISDRTVASTTAVGATSGQTIVVTAVDAAGNRVTDFNGAVDFTVNNSAATATKIISYYNYSTGAYTTLDAGGGTYSDLDNARAMVKGEMKWRTRSTLAGTKSYTIAQDTTGALATNATAKFKAGSLDKIVLSGTPVFTTDNGATKTVAILGNGSSVANLTAKFTDSYGNTVTAQTGTVYFYVDSDLYGGLLTTSANAVNGVATISLQSRTLPSVSGFVAVHAVTDVTKADGNFLTAGSRTTPADLNVTVDALRPNTTSVATGGTASDTVAKDDTITITFSEAVRGNSIVSGLTAGGAAVTTGVGNVVFTDGTAANDDSITFSALNLGSIKLDSGALAAGKTFAVASVSLSNDGTTLTITLGDPTVAGALAIVDGTAVYTPSTTILDFAGNKAWFDAANPGDVLNRTFTTNF